MELEKIITEEGSADTAPSGAEKINRNFDKVAAGLDNAISKATTDLENYYLKAQTYTREEVQALVAAIKTASFKVVATLPATGEGNVIYLVPNAGAAPNTHDEYIWVDGAWEIIGNTAIDVSGKLDKTGDASDTTVTFVPEAGEPVPGGKMKNIIGRLVKKLADIVSGTVEVGKAANADAVGGRALNGLMSESTDSGLGPDNVEGHFYGFGYSRNGWPTNGSYVCFGGPSTAGYLVQIQTNYMNSAEMWTRSQINDNGAGWGHWKRFAMAEELPGLATIGSNGLMSGADKQKLDGLSGLSATGVTFRVNAGQLEWATYNNNTGEVGGWQKIADSGNTGFLG